MARASNDIARPRLAVFLAMAALPAFGSAGCVDINGGAVEVPWTVFAQDGRGAINDCACADPAIAFVRLKLGGTADNPGQVDPCATADSCRFSCGRKIGATPFMIPPGAYLMSIEPETEDGAPIAPELVTVPAPVLRQVARGTPTELDAFEIDASCAVRCHGADVERPCDPG